MRLIKKMFLAVILTAAWTATALAGTTTTLKVRVELADHTPVDGADVIVVNYGMNGPTPATQVAQTSGGEYTFTISTGMGYSVYFNKHGYSPTLRDQFNNPDPSVQRWFWPDNSSTPLYSTFTVVNDQVNVGHISLPFKNAKLANEVLFGNVNVMNVPDSGYMGITKADATVDKAGTLTVDNVPAAKGGTYNIGIYDPLQNRGINRMVLTELVDGENKSFAQADFNNAVPPARVENTATQNSGSSSNAAVEGVVQELGFSTTTVPHMGLTFRYCASYGSSSLWANTDEDGRFQLFNLTPGTTYYAEAMGGCAWSKTGPAGCFAPYRNSSLIDPCQTSPAPPAPTANDFLYVSTSEVQSVKIELPKMPPSTGFIRVYVKSADGYAIPNANVNISPDGSMWSKDGCAGMQDWTTRVSTPGFANNSVMTSATGYALLSGLPSGNYMINVWTPFSNGGSMNSMFNIGGSTSGFSWQDHCSGDSWKNFRVHVATNNVKNVGGESNGGLYVYDGTGAELGLSSVTYIVNRDTLGLKNVVKGNLTFPDAVDLGNSPIMITLYGQCKDMGPCPAGNFKVVNDGSNKVHAYEVFVATGDYYMNINSVGWGRISRGGGDNSIHMPVVGSTVTVDMEFVPAGVVSGTLYKPDGSVYSPANNEYIWIDADTNNGWAGAQVQKDGTFLINSALPGLNRINMNISNGGDSGTSSFNYALPSPFPNVNVIAGSTVTVDINLVDAVYVQPKFNLAKMPDQTVIMEGWDQLLGFKAVPLQAGSVFNTGTIIKMLTGGDSSNERKFRYSSATVSGDMNKPCGDNWPGGFCAAALPSPGVYDFYLMRSGDFGKMDPNVVLADRPYPHFTMVTSSRNVVVDSVHASTSVWASAVSKSTGVAVDLTPAEDLHTRGNATLGGAVGAANFFRQADYDACGGDFDKFVQYLPVMSLYREDNGSFAAAGIVVPQPSEIAKHDAEFNMNFTLGYTKFRDFLGTLAGGLGYEIRGLAPGKCYTAVLSTPNYPHYQKRVCMGADGSKTTLNVDLDSAVGAGAVVTGVVKSSDSASAVLPNVSVVLAMDGSEDRTATTGADGKFRFEGLSAGVAKIAVTVSSFAAVNIEQAVAGSRSYDLGNIYLEPAPGAITGTVYSQKLPFAKVQPGAQIVAYDVYVSTTYDSLPLPLLKTRTGSDGAYKLDGLVPGHIYKVFLKVPGKYVLSSTYTATAGLVSGADFTMLAKPLDIEMFAGRDDLKKVFRLTVLNPQDFRDGSVYWGKAPFGSDTPTELKLQKLSSGEMAGEIPFADIDAKSPDKTIIYTLRGSATSYANKSVTREVSFGFRYNGDADQHIDDLLLGDDSDDGTGRKNNEAVVDRSGNDPSSLVLPAGALITSTASASVPTCSLKAEDKNSAAVSTKTAAADTGASVASSLYTVSLSSVAQTNRSIELTLAYDKTITDTSALTVKQYNNATGKWEDASAVPATINPVKGTVTVKLKKLASVLSKRGASPQAVMENGQYLYRPQASGGSSSTSGTFAVMNYLGAALPDPNGKLKVFNYPNPFNLKSKAMSNNHNATTMPATTNGTMIHVEVPAGNDGPCHIRIYTLAGELVKDISDYCTGGKYNYFAWDGHNSGGQEVANGVYYGVVDLSGKKPDLKDYVFKMAVIK